MALTSATYELGPTNASMQVRTAREGAAARLGHDLVFEATRWEATLMVDADDTAKSTVTAKIDARSLELREGTGGAKPLSAKDVADIGKNIAQKVLHTDRHPEIAFRSTSIDAADGGHAEIAGSLTLLGTARPVRVHVDETPADGSVTFTGVASIVQSDWGIKPYSAVLGALKVRDAVELRVEARFPVDTAGQSSQPALATG